MKNLSAILLAGTALLFIPSAEAGPDRVFNSQAEVLCSTDGICALLGSIQVRQVTDNGSTAEVNYDWAASTTCGSLSAAQCFVPAGTHSGAFKMRAPLVDPNHIIGGGAAHVASMAALQALTAAQSLGRGSVWVDSWATLGDMPGALYVWIPTASAGSLTPNGTLVSGNRYGGTVIAPADNAANCSAGCWRYIGGASGSMDIRLFGGGVTNAPVIDMGLAANAAYAAIHDKVAPQTLLFPRELDGATYSTNIVNTYAANTVMHFPLIFSGTGAAITVGSASATTAMSDFVPSYYNVKRATVDFTDASAGIDFLNIYHFNVHVTAENFQKCVRTSGGPQPQKAAYGDIYSDYLWNCQKGFYIQQSGGANGIMNQVNLHLGRVSESSNSAAMVSAITFDSDGTAIINGWTIDGLSWEGCNANAAGGTIIEVLGATTYVTAQQVSITVNRNEGGSCATPHYLIAGTGIFKLNTLRFPAYVTEGLTQNFYSAAGAAMLSYAQNSFYFGDRWGGPNLPMLPMVGFNRRNVVGTASGVEAPARGFWFDGVANTYNGVMSYGALAAGEINLTNGGRAMMVGLDVRNVISDVYRRARIVTSLTVTPSCGTAVRALGTDGSTEISSVNSVSAPGTFSSHMFIGTAETTQTLMSTGYDVSWDSSVGFIFFGLVGKAHDCHFNSFKVYTYGEGGAVPFLDASAVSGMIPLHDTPDPYTTVIPTSTEPTGTIAHIRTPVAGSPPFWFRAAASWLAPANL